MIADDQLPKYITMVIIYYLYHLLIRVSGKPEPITADFRWELRYTLDRSSVYRGAYIETIDYQHSCLHLWTLKSSQLT